MDTYLTDPGLLKFVVSVWFEVEDPSEKSISLTAD